MRNPLNVLGGNLGDFGEFCKGLTVYVYVMKPHDASIAAMAVDTVGEGLRHMDALNPPL